MNTFNSSFVTEMTKLAQPGSGMSPLAKALALGGAGVGAYGLYKAHAANQAAQQAAAAAAASKSRMKTLLGLGLLGSGAAAAHHFGLDAGILEKLKGLKSLFGGGAAEAASAAPAAVAPAAMAPIEAYSSPIGPELPKLTALDKFVNLAKQKMNAGIEATKAGKEYGEVRKAFGIPALDVEGGPNQYGATEANKNFLYNKATGKMLYNEPGMVSTKERIITSPGGENFVVPNRPYAGLPAAEQFRALQNNLGIPIGADGSVNPAVLAKMSPEAKEALLKDIKEIKTIGAYQNMPIRPSAITPPDLSPSKFGPKYTPAGIGPRIGIN